MIARYRIDLDNEVNIFVRQKGGKHAWGERYVTAGDPQLFAEALVAQFNETLRPGEPARELVSVTVVGRVLRVIEHKWSKTNLITRMTSDGVSYDTVKCERCGITGRRYGLRGYITRDKRWAGEEFEACR